MNRKILAGAMALALPLSIVGVNAADAKAKKAVFAITTVTLTGQSPTATGEGSNQIAPYQTATLTITGTALPFTTANAAAGISSSTAGQGLYGLLGSSGLTIKSVSAADATHIVATVQGPTGNNILYTTAGYNPGNLTINLIKTPATSKKAAVYYGSKTLTGAVVSNCGSSLGTAATAGTTYGTTPDGSLDLTHTTGTADVAYFDVQVNAILATGNLCADDIGTTTTTGTPVYNTNYPVTFATGAALAPTYTIPNISFSFPYTAANKLSVYGENESFQLGGGAAAVIPGETACGQDGATEPAGVTIQSCTVSATGLVTLQATGTTSYTKGDTIQSPRFSITGIATSGATLVPVNTTSEIGLYTPPASGIPSPGSCTYSNTTKAWTTVQGGNGFEACTSIIFAPRTGSSNASYSVASSS